MGPDFPPGLNFAKGGKLKISSFLCKSAAKPKSVTFIQSYIWFIFIALNLVNKLLGFHSSEPAKVWMDASIAIENLKFKSCHNLEIEDRVAIFGQCDQLSRGFCPSTFPSVTLIANEQSDPAPEFTPVCERRCVCITNHCLVIMWRMEALPWIKLQPTTTTRSTTFPTGSRVTPLIDFEV